MMKGNSAAALMNNLYEVTDTLLICQTIGCLAGLCVSALLIQLVRKSWGFGQQRRPGILLSLALVAWNLGGLLNAGLIIAGFDYQSNPAKMACAFGYSGLALLTWAILDVWNLSIQGTWRKRINRIAQGIAIGFGTLITAWLWTDAIGSRAPLSRTGIRVLAEAGFYVLVFAGVGLALSNRPARTTRLCAWLTAFGVVGPVAALVMIPIFGLVPQPIRVALSVYAEQSVNYVVVAAFILLARLRYTDTLVERALQCFTAIFGAALLWYGLLNRALSGPGLAVAIIATVAALVLATPLLNRHIRHFTERIFQRPDFDGELISLAESLRETAQAHDVVGRVEAVLIRLFSFARANVVGAEWLPADVTIGGHEILEYQPGSEGMQVEGKAADALVPIWNHGNPSHAIVLARAADQRGFLASEVAFLVRLAHLLGDRLETLRTEREKREREQRETLLIHQTTEAELRALRTQINPHFLFNALNTIADLIVVDAQRAERMTERLSEVFRYLLTHSQRPTITVREEIDFVRRYLEIEEVRFRDRLRVRIEVDPAAAELTVPALILQPLVENALKHGLAPKISGGILTVSANRSDSGLLLTVEDDGVGVHKNRTNGKAKSTGLGLANTTQRLRTLYGEGADVVLESPGGQGCRVTIRISEQSACAL
jgi:two-component system, LytTR family, sensor kinase